MFDEIMIGKIDVAVLLKVVIILGISFLLMLIFSKLVVKLLRKVANKFGLSSFDEAFKPVEKCVRRIVIITGLYFAFISVPFNLFIIGIATKVYRVILILVITGGLLSFCSVLGRVMSKSDNELVIRKPALGIIFPLLFKILSFLIIVLAVVIVASEIGFDQLQSILAGIGIGGVAIAFAAQDLLKNVFGGFIILTDKTFNSGDLIKIDSNEGFVEEVGIRSTKVRTLDKELIVVPNSKFADGAVINYSKRGTRRVKQVLGATYSTSSTQLKSAIDKINTVLIEDSRIVKNSSSVRFDNFGDSALEILVVYFTDTSNYDEYMAIKQDINYKIMTIFEEEGISFAFPSMSVYMEK